MPQDLPGFYYDAEKNRYFPNKPRIPGSSSFSNASPSQNNPLSSFLQATKLCPKTRVPASKLLHLRELNGNAFSYDRGRHSFVEEFHKLHASKPVVWRYGATDENLLRDIRYSALEQTQIDVQTLEGQMETEVLLVGSMDGSLSSSRAHASWLGDLNMPYFLQLAVNLLKVGSERHFDYGITHIPDRVWPSTKGDAESDETPPYVSRPAAAPLHMPSRISSIRLCEKQSFSTNNYDSKFQCSLYPSVIAYLDKFFNILKTLIPEIFIFSVIWMSHRTDIGVALVNVERGATKWVCRSKSDVLAVQFDQTGNIVLCGLRNGAIVTVDVRENQERMFSRLTKLKIPYSSSGRSSQKRWFEIKGLISPSHTIHMPSSISRLMKLYDHRLTKRGAVQSYGGHVNSHTRIQLGVDQSERFVMSGEGERTAIYDCGVSSPAPWERKGEIRQNHNCRAWLASEEGLFHMHWS
ncbi:hypothetical protein GOBAR_DD34168 [Gossypium barbadense]|nr:hypothetical protein GOBAR_DD34168 [Gossypium barbadense]